MARIGMNKESKEVTLLWAFGVQAMPQHFSNEEKEKIAAIVRELARQLNTESILALSELVCKLRKGKVA